MRALLLAVPCLEAVLATREKLALTKSDLVDLFTAITIANVVKHACR